MNITKHDFGIFVTERRRDAGLTQRQLAEHLHVTESAVSKWERGLSYPDITIVAHLADALGVSTQELINASEDRLARADRRDARTYRRWRGAVLWTTLSVYAAAILTCFIVNLSVSHTLTWFWTVLPAVLLAFCLTSLPLLPIPKPGWSALWGAVLSLAALLCVVWIGSDGGSWLPIALASVLLGLIVVFGPIWLSLLELPTALSQHRTVISLALDTVGALLLLLVIMVSMGAPKLWLHPVLPLAAIALAPIWVIALVLRYLPVNRLGRWAVAVTIAGACAFAIDRAVDRVLGEDSGGTLDLTRWDDTTINANVQFFVLAGALLIALVLGVSAIVRASRTGRAVPIG